MDIGCLDANACSGDFNVSSAELENVIAAVPPSSRSRSSAFPMKCVKAEASVTEQELVKLCSVHLGTINRMELREPFWVDRERARTLARTSQEVRVIHLLRRVL
jgi:hypothetical protein